MSAILPPGNVSSPFQYPVHIQDSDIDHMGHVNNAQYLRWVQEAVMAYWREVAPPEAIATWLWVATRHEISYRRPLLRADQPIASVIARSMHGARVFFTTIFKRGEDLIAEVESCWCCLDSVTKRPVRLSHSVARLFLPPS